MVLAVKSCDRWAATRAFLSRLPSSLFESESVFMSVTVFLYSITQQISCCNCNFRCRNAQLRNSNSLSPEPLLGAAPLLSKKILLRFMSLTVDLFIIRTNNSFTGCRLMAEQTGLAQVLRPPGAVRVIQRQTAQGHRANAARSLKRCWCDLERRQRGWTRYRTSRAQPAGRRPVTMATHSR